jgi:peptidoglycan-associated lipoprotein
MSEVLFDYDRYEIRSDQQERLLSMATFLKQNPSFRFRIEGNADERGSQEYNIALGDERASSVMRFLSTQGVAENRMTTVSYGEERPVCRDQDESCWQKNRRAAFVRIP